MSTDIRIVSQRLGKAAYKRGDYKEALQRFVKAVSCGDPSAELLDNVAATYARQGDLETALNATKKTLRTWPHDPTGYLRAAKILTNMGKKSTAFEICEYGMRQVKPVGSGYEQLKAVHGELHIELAPKNSIDPLTVLPREIALVVLQYLSFRERTKISRVSKGWQSFIRSEPNLWSHMDLSGAKSKVPNKFVSTAINAAKSRLVAATINRPWDFDRVLAALVARPSLERLTLAETGYQGDNLVKAMQKAQNLKEVILQRRTEISTDKLDQLMRHHCNKLRVFRCDSLQNLVFHEDIVFMYIETLELIAAAIFGLQHVVNGLANHAHNLRSLTLKSGTVDEQLNIDLRKCTALERLDVQLVLTSYRQFRLPPSLRVLNLTRNKTVVNPRGFFPQTRAPEDEPGLSWRELPNLEELSLQFPFESYEAATLGLDDVRKGTEGLPVSQLHTFSTTNPELSEDQRKPFEIPNRLRDIGAFSLVDCLAFKDRHLIELLNQAKSLQYLDVRGTSITGVSVKEAVKCGHVKEMVADDCLQVYRDAVDWAREQGMKVSFRTTNVEKSGKKIRSQWC